MVQQSSKTKFRIKLNRFYFIDLKDPIKPKLLRDSFYDKDEAKEWHEIFLKKPSRYFIIKGKELVKYKGQYEIIKHPYPTKAFRYDKKRLIRFNVIDDKQIRKVNRRRRWKKAFKERNITIKYEYEKPPEGMTRREEKTYRERMRRKIRRKLHKQIKPKLK